MGDPSKAPQLRNELPDKRTANSRTFGSHKGAFTTEIFVRPIHYKDAAGRWQKIDNRLKASSRTGFAWENTANRFKAFLSANSSGDLVRVELEGKAVSFKLVGSQSTAIRAQDNRGSFAGVFPKTDLRFDVREDRIKEEIVLLDKDPATLNRSFTFELRLEGLEARKEAGQVAFYSGTKRLMFVPAPFMYDSADKGKTKPPAYSNAIQMELSGRGPTFKLVLKPDVAWLSDPARVFPVYVDPTIVMQPDSETGKDSYLDSWDYLNHGNEQWINAGSLTPSRVDRGVLQFDLSYLPPGQYPPPNITSALLYIWRDYTATSNTPVNIHRITGGNNNTGWKESEVTWNNRNNQYPWDNPGGDYDPSPSATFTPPEPYQWTTVPITGLVTAWVNGTSPNYGMLLKTANEGLTDNWYRFGSSDYVGRVPELQITYDYQGQSMDVGLEPYYGALSWDLGAGTSLYVTHTAGSNVVLKKDILSIPGRGPGFNISMVYNYRAFDRRSGSSNTGSNWWLSLPRIAPFGSWVLFLDEDATYSFFMNRTDQGDGTYKYQTPAGQRYALVEDLNTNRFYLKHDSGLVHEFDRTANMAGLGSFLGPFRKLLKTYDSFHPLNYLTYVYTADNYIDRITDSSDSPRSLVFSWESGWSSGSKVLKTITDPAGIITTLNYQSYGPEGNKEAYLVSIAEATGTLDQRTVSFGYAPYSESEWWARLTAVTDARTDGGNHTTTIEYDNSYYYDPVGRVIDARGYATSFSYHTSMPDGDRVYVEDALGALNRWVLVGSPPHNPGAIYLGNTYNASFERPGSGSYPEKWWFNGDPNYATGSRDTTVSYKGSASARTLHTGPVSSYWDQWLNYNSVFASPGTQYTGKVWMKLSGVTVAAYMRIWYWNEDSQSWGVAADSPVYSGTADWFEASTPTFTFPANWKKDRIMLVWLVLDGTGTAWWDMARVESTGMQATWDSNLMTTFTDGAGLTSTLTWGGDETSNPNGNPNNLVLAQDHLGNKVTYKYDRKNHVIEQRLPSKQPLGPARTFTYSPAADLLQVTNELNGSWVMTYDPNGRGQLLTLKDPNGASSNEANPTGMAYQYTHNGYGYVTEIKIPKDSSSGWLSIQMEYDNLRGLMTLKTEYPETSPIKTRYEYDNLYRLKKVTYDYQGPEQYSVEYTYDGNGNRLTMVEPRGTSTYQYWETNLPQLTLDPRGTFTWYFYDAVSNLYASISQLGDWVYYYYDNMRRPVAVRNPYDQQFSQLRYDNKGRLGRKEVPGIVVEYGYIDVYGQDQGNRLKKQDARAGQTLLKGLDYSYDRDGNLEMSWEREGSQTLWGTTYYYDAVGRLDGATRTSLIPPYPLIFSQHFTYDPNGNRKTMIKDGATKTYYYDAANFLTQITGSPTYNLDWYGDTNLDREKEGETVEYDYGYDRASNLTSLNVTGGSNFTYASDGDGRRVSRTSTSPAETFIYHYSILGMTLEQKNGVDQARYVRLPNGVPLSITTASGTFYYLYDASGNVVALLGNGTLEAQYLYFPFGEDLGTHPEIIYNPLRFAGAYRDMQGGSLNKYQYYLGPGYHDPTYGRLTQAINGYPNFPAVSRAPLSYIYAWNKPATPPGRTPEQTSYIIVLDVAAIAGDLAIVGGPVVGAIGWMVSGYASVIGTGFTIDEWMHGKARGWDVVVSGATMLVGFVPVVGIGSAIFQLFWDDPSSGTREQILAFLDRRQRP